MPLFNYQPSLLVELKEETLIILKNILVEIQLVVGKNPYTESEDVIVTFGAVANVEQEVTLVRLNRTPLKYNPIKMDRATIIYDGTSASGKNSIYLKSSVADSIVTIRFT